MRITAAASAQTEINERVRKHGSPNKFIVAIGSEHVIASKVEVDGVLDSRPLITSPKIAPGAPRYALRFVNLLTGG